MKKTALILVIILSAAFIVCLTACDEYGAVESVAFADERLKTVYEIDETFDLDAVKLDVICQNKVRSAVVGADAVTGFDTSTCGRKTLTVECEGFTAEWAYTVEYTKEVNRTVNTSARVNLEQEAYPTGIRRAVGIERGELNKISAVMFTVSAEKNFADKDFSRFEVEPSPYFSCRLFYVNAKTVRVLVYAAGTTEGDEICKFNLLGLNDCKVKLSEISVSDGEDDYYLPETEEV